MLGLLFLHLQRACAHAGVLADLRQIGEEVARALLVMQGDLQGMIGLHQVMQLGRIRGLGSLRALPAHVGGSDRRLIPAHLFQDLVGVDLLDARQLAKQLGHLAVIVHFHRIGELGVALRRFGFHGVGIGHELRRAGHRRFSRRFGQRALRCAHAFRLRCGRGLLYLRFCARLGARLRVRFCARFRAPLRDFLGAFFRAHSANSASRSDGCFLPLPIGGW